MVCGEIMSDVLDPEKIRLAAELTQVLKEFYEKKPDKFEKLFPTEPGKESDPAEVENFVQLFLQNLQNLRVKKDEEVVNAKELIEEMYDKYGQDLPAMFQEEAAKHPELEKVFIEALIKTLKEYAQ